MRQNRVSALMLERYRLGELSLEDQNLIREAVALDENLRSRLESLDQSDQELRASYPVEIFGPGFLEPESPQMPKKRFAFARQRTLLTRKYPVCLTRIAVLLLICILLPVVYCVTREPTVHNDVYSAGQFNNSQDRAKGTAPIGCELLIYLMGDNKINLPEGNRASVMPSSDGSRQQVPGQTVLHEGDTIQLAYTAPAGKHYGVIYSIDGRYVVTLHYPYQANQSSLLMSGKRTVLDEAYTLDDAPDYEVFVMLVSATPLDVAAILREAKKIADLKSPVVNTPVYTFIEEKSREVFHDCEVKIVTVLKK